jgi:hypothetical protein
MGFLLFAVAFLLSAILYPIGILTTLTRNLLSAKFRTAIKQMDRQLFEIAASIDAGGNTICEDLFNTTLIQKDGYKFGNRKETISSVLGKNQQARTLTWAGLALAALLDAIDKDHCMNSIDPRV